MMMCRGKCIINLVLGSLVFICLFYLLHNWQSDSIHVYCVLTYTLSTLRQYTRVLCTHLYSQYTQTIYTCTVYSLILSVHSDNIHVYCVLTYTLSTDNIRVYCVLTYTLSTLRQFTRVLCTHLYSQYTQKIYACTVYSLILSVHSDNIISAKSNNQHLKY